MNIILVSDQPATLPKQWQDGDGMSLHGIPARRTGLIETLTQLQPAVVILDCDIEQMLATAQDVCAALPGAAVVPVIRTPSADLLMELLRLGVADVMGSIDEVTPPRISALHSRRAALAAPAAPAAPAEPASRHVCRMHAFISGKGGSGTTMAVANYAHALAQGTSTPVLVIDLSIPWGDLDLYLANGAKTPDLAEFLNAIDRIDHPLFKAMIGHLDGNIDLIPAPLDPARALTLKSDDLLKLIATATELYDWIIFDFGSSMNYMNIAVSDMLETLHVVSRPDIPSARRTGQLLKILQDIEFPQSRISIVLNESLSKVSLPVESFEAVTGHGVAARLPFAGTHSAESGSRGQPIMKLAPKSSYARAIVAWVGQSGNNPHKDQSKWPIFARSLFR